MIERYVKCEAYYHVDTLSIRITLQMCVLSLCTRVQLVADWEIRHDLHITKYNQTNTHMQNDFLISQTVKSSSLTLISDMILLLPGEGTESTHRTALLFVQNIAGKKRVL